MKQLVYIICAVLAVSCSEENTLHPYGKNDGQAPGKVTEITVRNMPGAAVIKYKAPADEDLLYVKAVYRSTRGEEKEVRSSAYVDSLYLEGFGDTRIYPVTLYAVDRHENRSEGTETTIQPETPPVVNIRSSLEYFMDFGGFLINFENKLNNDIAIYALQWDDKEGDYAYYDAMYTSQADGHFAVRGLPNTENKFGVYVRDRYDNCSDTLFFTGTPIKEDYLDKKLFKEVKCAGDAIWTNSGGAVYKLWDDTFFVSGNMNHAHTNIPTEFPHRLTIDLGVKVQLSRMKEWQRSIFEHGSIKRFRAYGCTELPPKHHGQSAGRMDPARRIRIGETFGASSRTDFERRRGGIPRRRGVHVRTTHSRDPLFPAGVARKLVGHALHDAERTFVLGSRYRRIECH